MKNKIKVWHGIYDSAIDVIFNRVGFFHEETATTLKMSYKLQCLLYNKGMKMLKKYGHQYLEFTLGKSVEGNIEAIAIVHPHYDIFDEMIGEAIVIGRIKRMRGDIRKPYDLAKRYRIKSHDGTLIAGELMYPFISVGDDNE